MKNDLSFTIPDDDTVFSPANIFHHLVKKKHPSVGLPRFCIISYLTSVRSHIQRNLSPVAYNSLHQGHPYFVFQWKNDKVAFQLLPIGAPAAGMMIEEAIALGTDQFLFLGSAGVLDERIPPGTLVLPTSALCDEGTSSHYLPGNPLGYPDPELFGRLQNLLRQNGLDYRLGKTWTTDAPYRETPRKIRKALREGCVTVDMEASALFTISTYHQKKMAGIFIAADVVTEHGWMPRKPIGNEFDLSRLLMTVADLALESGE